MADRNLNMAQSFWSPAYLSIRPHWYDWLATLMKFFYLSLYTFIQCEQLWHTITPGFSSFAMTPRAVSSQTRGTEFAKHAVYSACCHNAEEIENSVFTFFWLFLKSINKQLILQVHVLLNITYNYYPIGKYGMVYYTPQDTKWKYLNRYCSRSVTCLTKKKEEIITEWCLFTYSYIHDVYLKFWHQKIKISENHL